MKTKLTPLPGKPALAEPVHWANRTRLRYVFPRKIITVIGLIILIGSSLAFMGCSKQSGQASATSPGKILYSCGMDPQVIQDHPGNCPICGMKLTPMLKTAGSGKTSLGPAKDSLGMDLSPTRADEVAATSSEIRIDPATIQNMNIQTTKITRGPLRRVIRTVGTIDYDETTLTDVTTKFKGWVEKLYVNAIGQQVQKNEPLFEIYSPDLYNAEVKYLLALNQMVTNDPSTSALRDTAESKLKFYDISAAQIAELEKTREPKKTLQMLAPGDGFVTEKMVVAGQMVDAGMKVYRLIDLETVWVHAQIYEQDLPYVQLGQEALVKLSALPDPEFRGRVTYIYPNVDEKTRTARVRTEFHNPGHFLKPGMFATVMITAELKPSVLLVPDSAVLRSGEKNTVFVALDGGRFEPRTVSLGLAAANDEYEVLYGLNEGERVVTAGQFMLDSESQLREAIQKMNGTAAAKQETDSAMAMNQTGQSLPAMAADGSGARQIVYVCQMPEHISIEYEHPGNCLICGAPLVPVSRAELHNLSPGGKVLYYTCPMPEHNDVHESMPGKCPRCGMTLIPVMEPPKLPAAPPPVRPNWKT